ncbi:MAG: Gfo/Idh/MocA family oxidoreductase [Bryobacterales bacterium]|nr:Gfo/Idh/MocA family oxidoreductase [Bryobacteraceae bacterium]MDW8354854.1 Gfo/Idh/MocA family oxidoreductase [Bryobacterales bacterium]
MSDSKPEWAPRRRFLESSVAAGALLVLEPKTVFGTQANSAIELGIIGCGGRGNWIGAHFVEFTHTRIVALHDPFRDRLEATAAKFKVDRSRLYGGLDGYKDLLASRVDAVAIESPPYFHPEQAAAAVAAGKHVFLAKPVAVDVAGCKSVLETGERAKGKVSFLVDFQTRAQAAFQEAARRVHEGAIGAPVLGHVFYHTGRLRPQAPPGAPAEEARLRNWVFDKVLSGDIIVEQNIHVLDVANWYLRAHPLRAFGTGGRKARVDVGDCWDHFVVTYWYADDVRVDFSSAQFTKGFHDMCIRIYGTAGTVDSHYGGSVRITGDHPWPGVEKDDTFREGAIANVKNFIESIRTGRLLNNAADSVQSNLTAVLGRMAAYGERVVSWDEMLRSNEKLDAKLRL